ncbi:MAG: sulfate ABC transporter permease subunit CysW [Firmicutes bacterium]|nr:sulfate ABC transporter permease subunit CysW [Bacillota bacterium]
MSPIRSETGVVRWILIGITVIFIGLMLVFPLVLIFSQAFFKGVASYLAAISNPDTLAAIRLTLVTVTIVAPLNLAFGLAAAWAIAKFNFKGKNLLITLIDLPFAVSPVVAGLIYMMVFGRHGLLGSWLVERNLKVVFALPGIVLATIFVTIPLVARELIPLMQSSGVDEEEAAMSLGAAGLQTFRLVTLPNIKWGVLYGVILCCARAMGEFGAVSVVSGHIRGLTNTMPLQIEILYNEYNFQAAFAAASLLALTALLTLGVKAFMERKLHRNSRHGRLEDACRLKDGQADWGGSNEY